MENQDTANKVLEKSIQISKLQRLTKQLDSLPLQSHTSPFLLKVESLTHESFPGGEMKVKVKLSDLHGKISNFNYTDQNNTLSLRLSSRNGSKLTKNF